MILVNIEYDHNALEDLYEEKITEHELWEIIERIEAMVGSVFYEEMSEIECRLRPFSAYDDHDHDVFVTIDCDQAPFRSVDPSALTDDLTHQIKGILHNIFNFDLKAKVWVRKVVTL